MLLPIAGYVEEVEVTRDKTDQNITDNFSSALTQDQIDALPDDEDEMAEQLAQMAGPGAVMRVNGFSGGRLPPKSQIAEIRFRFDPYSAENHEAGFPRVDILTRPGNGDWRNNATFAFRDESLNARNAFATEKAPEQARRYRSPMDGPIEKGKTSFSFNIGGMDSLRHRDHPRGQPRRHAVRRHRVEADRPHQPERPRRARHQQEPDAARRVLAQQQRPGAARRRRLRSLRARLRSVRPGQRSSASRRSGPVFRKMRNEVRLEVDWSETVSNSFSDARTISVKEAFTSGGAQVAGGRKSKTIEFADNLDFALGKKHALRAGVLVEGGWYRSDETRNFNGTYTFSSNDAYLAGAGAAVLAAHRRSAGRIQVVPVRRLPAGRLPRPEEPAGELRPPLRSADAPERQHQPRRRAPASRGRRSRAAARPSAAASGCSTTGTRTASTSRRCAWTASTSAT